MSEQVNEEISSPLADISFRGASLERWEVQLTVMMPSLPTTNAEITRKLGELHNKYQQAYNAYNELVVICAKCQRDFDQVKRVAMEAKRREFIENEVRKMPAKEIMEELSIASSEDAHKLKMELFIYETARDFFLHNKNKLERSMQLAERISYNTVATDRVSYRQGDPRF